MNLRPLGPGVGPITAPADGPSEVVALNHAAGFWVTGTENTWVTVSDSATPVATLDETNAVLIAADQLYGPFTTMTGLDTHIHVAGDGVGSTVIITPV
jgi:hypothetical protein